jgi:hypothetical protein
MKPYRQVALMLSMVLLFAVPAQAQQPTTIDPTPGDETWHVLNADQLPDQPQHTEHLQRYGEEITGYNRLVLEAIDKVQNTATDGGGYFIGIKADPPESPIGYGVTLFDSPLLEPPRQTSYCSGATYTTFIETLNLKHQLNKAAHQQDTDEQQPATLGPVRTEAMRMQEPGGGRREDGVKFWGHWNDDGFGTQFALVQYAQMGKEITPQQARPGDFMNISWANGGGHSVVFLGWFKDDEGVKHLLYWSSQKSTNGMGDQLVPVSRIKEVKIVRLTKPDSLFTFDTSTQVNRKVPGNIIDW